MKVTADTVTDEQLLALFARHCECRPLFLGRRADDHAARHDCDTEILADVQFALGVTISDGADHVEVYYAARERCADHINRDEEP
jgi:hypothetical protein